MGNLKNSAEDNAKIDAVMKAVEKTLTSKEGNDGEHNDESRIAEIKKMFNTKENAGVEGYEEVSPVHAVVFDPRDTATQRVRTLNGMFGIELDKDGYPVKVEVKSEEVAETAANTGKKGKKS